MELVKKVSPRPTKNTTVDLIRLVSLQIFDATVVCRSLAVHESPDRGTKDGADVVRFGVVHEHVDDSQKVPLLCLLRT